jgi:hypothetical protein
MFEKCLRKTLRQEEVQRELLQADSNRMDRIDRIKKEMMKAECGMMNEKHLSLHPSFRLSPSVLLLSCLSCPSC